MFQRERIVIEVVTEWDPQYVKVLEGSRYRFQGELSLITSMPDSTLGRWFRAILMGKPAIGTLSGVYEEL